MMIRKWWGFGLSVTLLSSVALVGCGGDATQPTTAQQPAKQEPQVLNLPISSEIPTLDSSKATDNLAFDFMGQVDEGLVRLDSTGKAVPGVAEKWDVSQDGLHYTFHLRDTAKWSDGSAVTAKDFEFAWKRGLDPKTGSEYAFMLDWIKGGEAYNTKKGQANDVQVKATDDKTLEVTLANPIPFFVEQMSFPVFYPQKQEIVEKYGDKYGADADKVLFNGPFKMTAWTHEQSATIEKNDNYWDKDNVKLTKVNFQFVQDEGALENLYQAGEVDQIPLLQDQVDRYKDKPEYHIAPQLATGYLTFNELRKPFDNDKIRKALTYAIDADQYADIIYHNGTSGATGYVPNGVADGQGGDFRKDNGDLINRKENAAKAKELLAEGMKEEGITQLPKFKLTYDDGASGKKATEFIQAQWKQNLGVDVDIDLVPFKLKLKRSRAHDFDVVLALWIGDYNDPMTFLDLWTSDSGFNDGSYKNAKYDQLVKAAKAEPDVKKRMQDMQDAEKQLMNDMPVGPIFFKGSSYILQPYVKGWSNHLASPSYDLKGVYIEGKK